MTVEGANIASTFLADVFGPSTAAPVFICSLPNSEAREREPGERHVRTRAPDEIEAFLRKWDRKHRAVYFAVATIKAGSTTRSKATLAELNGLHVDIDAKSITMGIEEAEQKLREVMHLPSKVVASGGGLHAYWLFKEALPATPENIQRVEALLRLLADHLGGDPACAEASRLMRLPGSHNTKGGAWTEVRVMQDRPLRYEWDDLAEWLETASPVIWRQPTGGNGHDHEGAINPWLVVAERFGFRPPIDVETRLAAMRYQGTGDASIHSTQISVSAALLNRGQSIDEVVEILLAVTHAATGPFGARWNWQREERAIRQMCESWLAKHPEMAVEQTKNKADVQSEKAPQDAPLLPYKARSFSEIPLRQWLHAGHYIRQQVVMTVAPGGYGKTSLIIGNAVEMCLGLGLMGSAPGDGAVKVAYWNGEDPPDEIERRIAAVCLRYDIDAVGLEGQLFLGTKVTGGHRIAGLDRHGNVTIDRKLVASVTQFIADNGISVAIFDPLVSFHRAPESDNVAMEQVVRAFEGIAAATDCCVELSQHTRKSSQGQQGELTADDSRGAGAIVAAARSVRVLNRMTAQEAELPKIAPDERRRYLRISRDKTNLVPPGKATWVRLASVELPNGHGSRPGDNVQAVEAWEYPAPLDGVTAADMHWIRETVRQGDYRRSPRSPDWVGYPLAKRLGLDADDRGDRSKLNAMLAVWFANGVLATETRKDE
jgi:hypothetical protein